MTSHVYLSPGFFGFRQIGTYRYFEHVERAIQRRYQTAGHAVRVHVCDVHPTASIRRRAVQLATTIGSTCSDVGAIHIVGHSTGGLDARLVTSPTVHLDMKTGSDRGASLPWVSRVRSVTTINTPHYGTPLAAFFATTSGQRLLYALSALTVTALSLGSPPLAATSALVAAFGRVGAGVLEGELVERTTEAVIRVLDDASSKDLRAFLRLLREDQAAIIQLTPEAMDVFVAGVEDRPGVRYQSVATFAPRHGVTDWIATTGSPWKVVSSAIFATLYNLTARYDPRYPCAPPGEATQSLRTMLGEVPPFSANDGVVPIYSQIWGDLLWAGKADHLDIVGHFPGTPPPLFRRRGPARPDDVLHTDWMASGARFSQVRFETVMDRIVDGMLVAEEADAR